MQRKKVLDFVAQLQVGQPPFVNALLISCLVQPTHKKSFSDLENKSLSLEWLIGL